MKILVHCIKPMLIVHRHPHLMMVRGIDGESMKHLAEPHDHHVEVIAKMECSHLERDKDLLLLHQSLQRATQFPHRVYMGEASFEQMCVILRERVTKEAADVLGTEPHIYSIKIAAHDEGAEIVWGDK